ncbi:hypothetical protein EVAR_87226_1 [Eumeta japonica]|uniref:Uncharacterized protein n=1 Tax=Eumeta variegata TaxID=151549 RepID=A0A4C1ZRT6_EUMVA|nr:hypothetical protein EVAR_87226_1 [Eumeta japonica]
MTLARAPTSDGARATAFAKFAICKIVRLPNVAHRKIVPILSRFGMQLGYSSVSSTTKNTTTSCSGRVKNAAKAYLVTPTFPISVCRRHVWVFAKLADALPTHSTRNYRREGLLVVSLSNRRSGGGASSPPRGRDRGAGGVSNSLIATEMVGQYFYNLGHRPAPAAGGCAYSASGRRPDVRP